MGQPGISDDIKQSVAWANAQGLIGLDGEVFIVDTAGAGDFLTMQEAVDACVSGRGDLIIKKRGGEQVTAAVNFNKAGITVMPEGMGYSRMAIGESFSMYSAAAYTDGPAGIITAGMTMIGMGFVSRDVGATFFSGAALLIGGEADASPFGVHLINCRFPKWGLDNRIGLAIEGSSDCIVEACDFEGVGSNFAAGIYVQGATSNLTLKNNLFKDCDQGILCGSFADSGGADLLIQGNVAMHGSLLNIPSGADGAIVDNYIPTKDVAAAYGGDSLATLEGRGMWFANNHYSETP